MPTLSSYVLYKQESSCDAPKLLGVDIKHSCRGYIPTYFFFVVIPQLVNHCAWTRSAHSRPMLLPYRPTCSTDFGVLRLLFPIIVLCCPIKNAVGILEPCHRDSNAKSNCCISILTAYEICWSGSFNYRTCCFQGQWGEVALLKPQAHKALQGLFQNWAEVSFKTQGSELGLSRSCVEIVSFCPSFSMSAYWTTALGFGLLLFLFSFFLGFFWFEHLALWLWLYNFL